MATPKKKAAPPKKVSGDTILKASESIKALASELEENARKFVDEEVKAAGKRTRANAQEIKKLCMSLRKDVMTLVNDRRGK